MFAIPHADTRPRWAPLPLRLAIGYGFAAHGWAKLSRGPAGFAALIHQIGLPFPALSARAVTVLELAGGAALLAGAYVSLVSVPLIATMLVAMFGVHWRYGLSSIRTIGLPPDGPLFGPPGYEVNLLYAAGLVTLIVGGAGAFSVDAWRSHRRRRA